MRQYGGSLSSNLIGVVIVLVVLYVLYYIYTWLSSNNSTAGITKIGGLYMPMSTTMANSNNVYLSQTTQGKTYVATKALKGLTDAGQYSTSTWVYVVDTKGFLGTSAPLANLLEISSGPSNRFDATNTARGKTILYIGLNPKNAALVVRQTTMDNSSSIDNTLAAPNSEHPSSIYPLSSLIMGYNSGTSYTGNDRCDIVNGIEYQRWVLISTVANGRTLDVYIDGKLARSCVYTAGYAAGDGRATAYVGMDNQDKLKGYFSYVNFFDYAQSPEEVWRTYQSGPGGPFNLWRWMSNIISINVSVTGSALNTLSPCAACQG